MTEWENPRTRSRDIEHLKALYAEKFDNVKSEIVRLNERMDKSEQKSDERHAENQEDIAAVRQEWSGMKVKMGMLIAGVTALLTTAASIVLKKVFGI